MIYGFRFVSFVSNCMKYSASALCMYFAIVIVNLLSLFFVILLVVMYSKHDFILFWYCTSRYTLISKLPIFTTLSNFVNFLFYFPISVPIIRWEKLFWAWIAPHLRYRRMRKCNHTYFYFTSSSATRHLIKKCCCYDPP